MGSPTVKRIFNQDEPIISRKQFERCNIILELRKRTEPLQYLNAILRCSKGLTGSKAQGRIMGCVPS